MYEFSVFWAKAYVLAVLPCITLLHDLSAQTVIDIFPTRVTQGSIVTIIGNTNNFSSTNISNLGNSIGTISITNKTLVSPNEISFEVSESNSNNELDQPISLGAGVVFDASVDTDLDYIGPTRFKLANNKMFFVKEIYTNWDHNNDGVAFWTSNLSDRPDDYHELLGFKMFDNKIFSTGVDRDVLEAELGLSPGDANYYTTNYKAYSTNGVKGRINRSSNFLLTGNKIDDVENSNEFSSNPPIIDPQENAANIAGVTVYESMIDGRNGLELGTGISNFNRDTNVRFFSGNGVPGVLGDELPDLLITQIAQAGGRDIYFYADNRGNVVGKPLELEIPRSNNTRLSIWNLDLFEYPNNLPFELATPSNRSSRFNTNETRPIRMVALKLSDFQISGDASDAINYIENIENINMVAGGTADTAFLAYNAATFDIKSPVADPLLSRFVCKTDGNSSVTFSVNAGVEDANGNLITPTESDQILEYQWSKFNIAQTTLDPANDSFTITNITSNELATYNLLISNTQGAVILPVTLTQGGTPTIWNGTTFSLPQPYIDAGILETDIPQQERGLRFNTDFNGADAANDSFNVLDVCDCIVSAGTDVIIGEDDVLKMYDKIIVEPGFSLFDEDGNFIDDVDDATLTLNNNASLIQTKNIDAVDSENTGIIKSIRTVNGLDNSDYIYWSSPVESYNIDNIPGNSAFTWNPNASNPIANSNGNWLSATNQVMQLGKGYIKRVPNGSASINTEFLGVPRNGTILVDVDLTSPSNADSANNHWNLLGNPYPSAINVKKFLETNAAVTGNPHTGGTVLIEGAVHLWTHGTQPSTAFSAPFYNNFSVNYSSSDYLSFNLTGSSKPGLFDGNIASGQGFFVKAITDGQVEFNNSMRFDDGSDPNGDPDPSGAYGNSNFFRSNGNDAETVSTNKLWLGLIDEDMLTVTTLLGYIDGATLAKDNLYDAKSNQDDFSIYSLIDDDKMVIQGRSAPFNETDVVPLGIKIKSDGLFKIGIADLKGADLTSKHQSVYLEDVYQNKVHDLKDSPYAFTAENGEYNDRFVLSFTNSTLSNGDKTNSDTFVFIKDNSLTVKANKQIQTIEIFDLTGKRVKRYYAMSQTEFSKAFEFSKGVYLVSVLFHDNTILNKKLIN